MTVLLRAKPAEVRDFLAGAPEAIIHASMGALLLRRSTHPWNSQTGTEIQFAGSSPTV